MERINKVLWIVLAILTIFLAGYLVGVYHASEHLIETRNELIKVKKENRRIEQ